MKVIVTESQYNNLLSTTKGYQVRPAVDEDYPQIKKIANQHRNFLPFVMRVAIEDSIKRGEVYVAYIDDEVIGFINFHKRKDGNTSIHEIGVKQGFMKMGVGKSLIDLLNKPIVLKVTEDNPANEFYRNLGFEKIGTQQGKKRLLNVYKLS